MEETPARIEPCLLDEFSIELLDLAASLSATTSTLGSRLQPRSAAGLAEFVRIMNCYYSNLIEGHNTTPREIERALAGQLETSAERRDLQVEARAHIRVQREIDRRHAAGTLPEPASAEFILLAAPLLLRRRSGRHAAHRRRRPAAPDGPWGIPVVDGA